MKTALIMVLSSDWFPYNMLMKASQETWDSVECDGLETIYYHSYSDKKSTDKVRYFPVNNDLHSIGKKTLMAFEWALANKKFDYIARPGANCFIHKRVLLKHIQTLPDQNYFAALEIAATADALRWSWGHGIVFSRDVVEQIVINKELWNHLWMEDVAMSRLVDRLGVPYSPAIACSIDRLADKWRCTCYGSESFEFDDFSDIMKAGIDGQFMYRCKQDYDRDMDIFVMKELFKYLK